MLLAGPTALAFFTGGYFDEARLWATIAAWALVAVGALASPAPLPRGRAARAAIAGLVALGAWTAASFAWAPLAGAVQDDLEITVLYLGALLAAAALVRGAGAGRAVEPALAAGAVIVIGYGLAERFLPGLLHYARSFTAGGRLEQPLTYWNAEGALAAIGLVLCARLLGDVTRPAPVRVAAAAASPLLGAGVYLSFSRGAIAAGVAGLIVVVAAAPTWAQARGAILSLGAAILGAAACGPFRGVASLHGSLPARERDGLIALALMVVIAGATGVAAARLVAAERPGRARIDPLPSAALARRIAAGMVGLIVLGMVVGALAEHQDPRQFGASAGRLTEIGSYRANYWAVAARAFVHHPLDGLGAGGFRVAWLRERTIPIAAQNVHSLELETAAELGLVGLAALALLLGGAAGAFRRAYRERPVLVAGWCGAATVWLLHSAIDWDWQMPALTLVAVVLAGAAMGAAERRLR